MCRINVRRSCLSSFNDRIPFHRQCVLPIGGNRSRSHRTSHISRQHFAIRVHNQPDVGEGTVEVDILEWFVKVGDRVKSLDIIGRGKYEKADVDILAPYAGVVSKLIIAANETARVHEPLIEFEVPDDSASDNNATTTATRASTTQPEPEPVKPTAQTTTDPATETAKPPAFQQPQQHIVSTNRSIIKALPSVRKMAIENSVDLSLIPPTGKHGHVTKEDLLLHMKNPKSKQQQPPPLHHTQSGVSSPPSPPRIQKQLLPAPQISTQAGDYVEKIIGVSRVMVKTMTQATAVPLFGYGDEIIMNRLVQLRTEMKQPSLEYGVKLTFLPFVVKAMSLALLEPESRRLNAHVNEDCTELTHRSSHNIGVAVDSPQGLLVPNIKDCQSKSILEIAMDLQALVERAKNSAMTPEDLAGGTIAMSNIGAIGGTYCHPILLVPQVCIGCIGALKTVPRYNESGEIYAAQTMAVSWSADHRVIDGATVARFSNMWKQYLENPQAMLIHLR